MKKLILLLLLPILSFGQILPGVTAASSFFPSAVEEKTYVPIPDAPTLTNTHTLVQATTGNGLQIGDLGGKTNFFVSGNYPFMQFNVVNGDDYTLMSLNYEDPADWSNIGSPAPNDYSLDCINASHGIAVYRLKFIDSDNIWKWPGSDTLGTLKQVYVENCFFSGSGFGGILHNQNVAGDGYGKFTSRFNSFHKIGGEPHYLGKTGSSVQKYMDTTRVQHCYMDSSGREAVQCNNHLYVMVENITARHGGQELAGGQGAGFQMQGVGAGFVRNSIFEAWEPFVIASTGIDLINNRIEWSRTDREAYLQDVAGAIPGGYRYKNVGDDTVRIEGNDFICDGYTLNYVLRLQEEDCVYIIRNNRFPPSAVDIYEVDGNMPEIILEGNTFDSDEILPVTYGNPPEAEYIGYHYLVYSDYDYDLGRGMRTPNP